MKNNLRTFAAAVACGLTLLSAQAWAAEGQLAETPAKIATFGISLDGFQVAPAGAGKHPAVLLLADREGVNEGLKKTARTFAQAGYVVLMPNFLSRLGRDKRPPKPIHPFRMLMGGAGGVDSLYTNLTVADADAAFDALKKDPSVDASKISVVGIGWGAWRAYKVAQDKGAAVYRLVTFYGSTPDDGLNGQIKAPVLAHYAQADFRNTALAEKTKQWIGDKFTYYIYPNAFVGFFAGGADGDVDVTSETVDAKATAKALEGQNIKDGGPEAKKLALERTLAFLK